MGWVKNQYIEYNNPKSDGGTVWGGRCWGVRERFSTRSNKLESQTLGNGKTDQILTKISQILF